MANNNRYELVHPIRDDREDVAMNKARTRYITEQTRIAKTGKTLSEPRVTREGTVTPCWVLTGIIDGK